MLVELHNQSQDRFVYTCNECKHHVETRFHCCVCEVRNVKLAQSFLRLGEEMEMGSKMSSVSMLANDKRKICIVESKVHSLY